jgi:hypothetical protein
MERKWSGSAIIRIYDYEGLHFVSRIHAESLRKLTANLPRGITDVKLLLTIVECCGGYTRSGKAWDLRSLSEAADVTRPRCTTLHRRDGVEVRAGHVLEVDGDQEFWIRPIGEITSFLFSSAFPVSHC